MRRTLRVIAIAAVLATTACAGGNPHNDGSGHSNVDKYGRPPEASNPVDADRDNVSTFALDVDTASYTYASRQIADGNWPARDTVRPEEFINALDYHYPQPAGDGFAVHVDGARLPPSSGGDASYRLLRIGLQTKAQDAETRPDAALTFVIDTSGSMQEAGKLDLVQDALRYLVEQLRPTDSVAIVTFNSRARVVSRMTRVSEQAELLNAIDSLSAGGSTNLGAGLVQGYDVARAGFRDDATNRVILLSDGLANTGTTDADAIVRKVSEEAGKQISLLGVGVGSDYGDALMERLADKGDGFVVYISQRTQARDLFLHKLPAKLVVRAYDAKAQVVFDADVVATYQLVGYEDRAIDDQAFRDDAVDGGEVGPGHSVTALYLVKLRPDVEGQLAEVKVRWLDPTTREPSEQYQTVDTENLAGTFDGAAPGLRACYVAGYFAEALRHADSAPALTELSALIREVVDQADEPTYATLSGLIRDASRLE
jgi:Ca-activated chloride channel family protein